MSRPVVVVPHPSRPEAREVAKQAIAWLEERGHEVRIPAGDAAESGLGPWACDEAALAGGVALAVSLGGDGTMLRTVDLVGAFGVPVLGLNLGRLGYLTECEPGDLEVALDRFFAGAYRIEERMTLQVSVERASGERTSPVLALNEAWLEKTRPGHTVHMQVHLAGRAFTTYAADGLIVATPTGSTAYNLSVRGPILSPALRAIAVTPVSPHQLFNFSLVLAAGEDVRVQVLDSRTATLLVDGRELATLAAGDALACSVGPWDARLVRFGEHDFHQILKAKFGLTDR